MTQVTKISKPGFNVLITGNANLTFNSELPTHAIFSISDVNKPVNDASVTVNHALGYVPKVWVFVEETDGDGLHLRRIPKDLSQAGESLDYYITTNDVVIEVEDSSIEYDFRVMIFTRSPNP